MRRRLMNAIRLLTKDTNEGGNASQHSHFWQISMELPQKLKRELTQDLTISCLDVCKGKESSLPRGICTPVLVMALFTKSKI